VRYPISNVARSRFNRIVGMKVFPDGRLQNSFMVMSRFIINPKQSCAIVTNFKVIFGRQDTILQSGRFKLSRIL
jgi:hypothetical protein